MVHPSPFLRWFGALSKTKTIFFPGNAFLCAGIRAWLNQNKTKTKRVGLRAPTEESGIIHLLMVITPTFSLKNPLCCGVSFAFRQICNVWNATLPSSCKRPCSVPIQLTFFQTFLKSSETIVLFMFVKNWQYFSFVGVLKNVENSRKKLC